MIIYCCSTAAQWQPQAVQKDTNAQIRIPGALSCVPRGRVPAGLEQVEEYLWHTLTWLHNPFLTGLKELSWHDLTPKRVQLAQEQFCVIGQWTSNPVWGPQCSGLGFHSVNLCTLLHSVQFVVLTCLFTRYFSCQTLNRRILYKSIFKRWHPFSWIYHR